MIKDRDMVNAPAVESAIIKSNTAAVNPGMTISDGI
jgi:hypothetical protein